MFIKKTEIKSIDFDGLKITDYTGELAYSSSFAEISVPVGIRHKLAWSKRSDKYYYVVNGTVEFNIDGAINTLSAGDFCIIPKGTKFYYVNNGPDEAKLILVHTPDLKLEYEVFEN